MATSVSSTNNRFVGVRFNYKIKHENIIRWFDEPIAGHQSAYRNVHMLENLSWSALAKPNEIIQYFPCWHILPSFVPSAHSVVLWMHVRVATCRNKNLKFDSPNSQKWHHRDVVVTATMYRSRLMWRELRWIPFFVWDISVFYFRNLSTSGVLRVSVDCMKYEVLAQGRRCQWRWIWRTHRII